MNEENKRWIKNLAKGKFVETVFAEMFRATKDFTVIPFGYENIIPELLHTGAHENDEALSMLRSAPDFAVIDRQTNNIYLIEIKYLKTLSSTTVLGYAQKMVKSWNPSFLFIASENNFYFDSIKDIIEKKGEISLFKHPSFPESIQQEYLKIIFEP